MPVLTVAPRRVDLGGGHYMITTAEVDTDRSTASFTEWMTCTNKLAGFTGGVLLTYCDAAGHVIGNSGVQQNGLGQAPLFGASHRTVQWNGATPAGTHGLTLAQFHDPHNRLGEDLLQALIFVGETLLTFCEAALTNVLAGAVSNPLNQQWCDDNPDWCGAVDLVGAFAGLAGDFVLLYISA